MFKFLKQIDPMITIMSTLVGATVFLFMTFTTFGYVDAKHESVMEVLNDIRASVKVTEQRVYELHGGK